MFLGFWICTEKGEKKGAFYFSLFSPLKKRKLKHTQLHAVHTLPFRGFLMGGQLLELRREREDYIKDYYIFP